MRKFQIIWVLAFSSCLYPIELFAENSCSQVFLSQVTSTEPASINSSQDFFYAMTRGMWLSEEQAPLFSFYLRSVFGNPKTHIKGTKLKRVFRILNENPSLEKKFFPEVHVTESQVLYPMPDDFDKWSCSFSRNTQKVRARLYQISANKGWWQKLLSDFGIESVEDVFDPVWQKELSYKDDDSLFENTQYLFSQLEIIQENNLRHFRQSQQGKRLNQVFADLIHSSPLASLHIQKDLKSADPLVRLRSLDHFYFLRDEFSRYLGFEKGWKQVLSHYATQGPTGVESLQDLKIQVESWRKKVLSQRPDSVGETRSRVRSLSLQESPFRSCLGGSDCSTQNYFDKALDPNYIYFTRTDASHHSSGHVTVVLGEALSPSGELSQVGFVDKIQNIPHQDLPLFLEAVRLSLESQSYVLALPDKVGTGRGLSNTPVIRSFVDKVLRPRSAPLYTGYRPHIHNYSFRSGYSRAEEGLALWALPQLSDTGEAKLSLGESSERHLAPEGLNIHDLLAPTLELHRSSLEEDQLTFLAHSQAMKEYSEYGLDQAPFWGAVRGLLEKSPFLRVKKQALYALILDQLQDESLYTSSLPEKLWEQLYAEIPQWKKSKDERKKSAHMRLSRLVYDEIALMSDQERTQQLKQPFRDINAPDDFGATLLILASVNNDLSTLNWVLDQPETHANYQDSEGDTALMWAARLGYVAIVERLLKDKRVDPLLRDHNGETALDIAVGAEQVEVIGLINTEINRRGLKH